ncbi:MAG: segregation and condensation protein A [Bulleidia sp.]
MEEFKVTLDTFDGPLDLMLHLIREKQLDLFNLDMNILTDQYIAYLKGMEQMQLEVAGEYLVELATLIEYKSRKMLPGKQEELQDEYEEDPKDRLVRRLLEYQQYREASEQLSFMYADRQKYHTRPLSDQVDEWMKEDSSASFEGNPYDLVRAMKRVMMRMRLNTPAESSYTVKEVSLEDRELEVRVKLGSLPDTFRFENLLDDVHDMPMFIATFLSVLDLARQHTIVFTVDDNDVIWFSKGENA